MIRSVGNEKKYSVEYDVICTVIHHDDQCFAVLNLSGIVTNWPLVCYIWMRRRSLGFVWRSSYDFKCTTRL
ncbi:hypothetical protein SNE40_016030 [Patella caerulea]|uniref:Uncharacterized protein n=1 Tax=Patella caerulea TaxID=87958 RepID=A0AAN8J8K7_PATCE